MPTHPDIHTTAGTVRGRQEGGVAVFRGIPYARPPIGPYRFRAPVRFPHWNGIREAGEFGPPAPQRGRTSDDSGNWLTVNVWSPDPGAARLPVLVWIHGGAYQQDTSANPHWNGAALAAAGAVVVSMNYRLGVEGFAHIDGAPDNRGLLDQVAALEWVRDNVAAFGGDPANVTVFGQSAGAGSIAALLAMPAAHGLFRRAIVQSLPNAFFSPALAADISAAIAAHAGAKPTIDELAPIPPQDLVAAGERVRDSLPERAERWGLVSCTPTPFAPVVDGVVLPRDPWSALAGGAARDIPLLIGHTRHEWRLRLLRLGGEVTRQYETLRADWEVRMPTLHLAQAQLRGGGPVWTYEFAWEFGPAGASHTLDVLLLLDTFGDGGAGAKHLGERLRCDWLAFATTGEPGWSPYDSATRTTRVYDIDVTDVPYPEETSRRIWRDHTFGAFELSG